jgi:hypothetical protein
MRWNDVRKKRDQAFVGNFMAAEISRVSRLSLQKHWAALWRRMGRISLRAEKRLRLCENLPLGERRFVAVVEFEKERFLLGGTASSLVLLARLAGAGPPALEEPQTKEDPLTDEDPAQTPLNALWSGGAAGAVGGVGAAGAVGRRRGERW